ncbi:hypothetical protein ABT369_11000 [Dactylosporangium sp. NPDC000244]|uniref:hypothetical protein n=1 Tax=Dactylosporangium sp. NPDC000244 TaxID=3154365 RepID=UPI003319EFFC
MDLDVLSREQDGTVISSTTAAVFGVGAAFALAGAIPAGLQSYAMSLYTLGSGAPVLQAGWADLVAGDVFLVNGQSNAAAQKRITTFLPTGGNYARLLDRAQHAGVVGSIRGILW